MECSRPYSSPIYRCDGQMRYDAYGVIKRWVCPRCGFTVHEGKTVCLKCGDFHTVGRCERTDKKKRRPIEE